MGQVMTRLLIASTVATTIESFLLPFADHFRAKGWAVDAMAKGATASSRIEGAFDRVFDAEWSRSPVRLANVIGSPGEVRSVVDDGGYDIVHVHTPVASWVTRFALRRRTHPPVVYTAHGLHFHPEGSAFRNRLFRFLEKQAAPWTDQLVVMNGFDELAAPQLGYPGNRVHRTFGIGVDPDEFDPDRVASRTGQLRAELGFPATTRLVLMVGEFIERKRHEDAIAAISQLDRDVHLLLAGSGPRFQYVAELAASLGCEERVHMLGHRQDVPELIAMSDILLLPSSQEGLPRCILESMSMATPVIASDIRGSSDLLEAGAGILVPIRDTARYAYEIRGLLADPERLRRMGQLGRQQVLERYAIDKILGSYEEIYEQAMRAGRRSR